MCCSLNSLNVLELVSFGCCLLIFPSFRVTFFCINIGKLFPLISQRNVSFLRGWEQQDTKQWSKGFDESASFRTKPSGMVIVLVSRTEALKDGLSAPKSWSVVIRDVKVSGSRRRAPSQYSEELACRKVHPHFLLEAQLSVLPVYFCFSLFHQPFSVVNNQSHKCHLTIWSSAVRGNTEVTAIVLFSSHDAPSL